MTARSVRMGALERRHPVEDRTPLPTRPFGVALKGRAQTRSWKPLVEAPLLFLRRVPSRLRSQRIAR